MMVTGFWYNKSMFPTFNHHLPYSLIQMKLKPESSIPQLFLLCMSAIPSTVTGSCTSCLISSKLYSVAEHLFLVDGGCLNSLLTADSIPSNSDHLSWDRSLDSFECLETYSHQW